jgi:hypothetical protein
MKFEAVFGLRDNKALTLSRTLYVPCTRCCGGEVLVVHDGRSNLQSVEDNLLTNLSVHFYFRMLVQFQPNITLLYSGGFVEQHKIWMRLQPSDS